MVWLSTEVAPSDGVKLLGDALSRAADEVVTDLRGRTLESDYVLDVAIEAKFSRGGEDVDGSFCPLAFEWQSKPRPS